MKIERNAEGFYVNPDGLCCCGCGQSAPIAKNTDRRDSTIKGQPVRFLPGHQGNLNLSPEEKLRRRKASQKNWRGKNLESLRSKSRQYARDHKEERAAYGKRWHEAHPHASRDYKRQNPEKVKAQKQKEQRKRRAATRR